MSISAVNSIKSEFSNIVYSERLNSLQKNKYIDLSDPNDGKQYDYNELAILSNPKKSTQYILNNTFNDYTKQIKTGNIPKNIPSIPIKQIIIYSNPLTTSYEINKMERDGRLSRQDAERLNNTLIKNSIGYGLNIL